VIVDSHVHLGRIASLDIEATAEELVEIADEVGVNQIFCTHCTALFYDMVEGNRLLAEAAKRFPDRIICYVTIPSPYWGDQALDEIRFCVEELGMRGLKIYSTPHGIAGDRTIIPIDDPDMDAVFEKAVVYRLPVLAHSNPEQCEAVAERFPELVLLMAHSGGTLIADGNWHRAIAAARRCQNIYLETCSSMVDMGSLEMAVQAIGPERIIYGSDTPLLDPFVQIARVKDADISDDAKQRILGDNMTALLGRQTWYST